MAIGYFIGEYDKTRPEPTMSTSPRAQDHRWVRWLLVPLALVLALYSWLSLTPSATVHYHKDALQQQRYVWNVQHRINRGGLAPGRSTYETGDVRPDDGFFMEFGWWNNRDRAHCISITPTLRGTQVYLDADGNVDWSPEGGTDVGLLKRCERDVALP